MLRPGFLFRWPRGSSRAATRPRSRTGWTSRCGPWSVPALALVLAGQGKAPGEWPVCPSPVELLPERELFALRKQFRGAWLPPRADQGPPPECQLAFHDREWAETQLPGLAAALRAGWQPGQRLLLRRVFTLSESRKRAATLHLPACAGELRVWFDGAALPVPLRVWTPVEVDLPDGLSLGPHVLCLELQPTQADPVWGELFVSRSDRAHLTSLRVTGPTASDGATLLAAVAGQGGAAAPLPLELQLWRVGAHDLRPLDQTAAVAEREATAAFRVHGAWRPAAPQNWIVRAVLQGKGGPADARLATTAPRGYRLEPTGVRIGTLTSPLLVVAASLAPAPDLPDQIQSRLARWRADGASCVLVAAPVHPSLLDAADRLGMLVLLEAPDQRAVADLERAWSNHPALCGFVVPLDTSAVHSSLPVLVRTERGLVRPGAVDLSGAVVALECPLSEAGAAWDAARQAGAMGIVLPEGRAQVLRTLTR